MNHKGIVLALLSAFGYTFQTTFTKFITEIPKVSVAPIRSCVQVIILIPMVQFFYLKEFSTQNILKISKTFNLKLGLFLRCLFGYASLTSRLAALRYISIGDSGAINALSSPLTAVVGYVWLREKISKIELWLTFVSFIGMVFVAHPWKIDAEDDGDDYAHLQGLELKYRTLIGISISLFSTILNSLTVVSIRSVGGKVHYMILTVAHCFWGIFVFFPIFVFIGWIDISKMFDVNDFASGGFLASDLKFIILVAICGTFGTVLKTMALKYEKAVIVQMLGTFRVVVLYVLQVFWIGEGVERDSLIGAGLILMSVVGLSYLKVQGK